MHLSLSRPRPLPAQGPAGEPGKPGAPGKPGTPGADVSRRTRTHGATRWWGGGEERERRGDVLVGGDAGCGNPRSGRAVAPNWAL